LIKNILCSSSVTFIGHLSQVDEGASNCSPRERAHSKYYATLRGGKLWKARGYCIMGEHRNPRHRWEDNIKMVHKLCSIKGGEFFD
jgi:hypothetical protein